MVKDIYYGHPRCKEDSTLNILFNDDIDTIWIIPSNYLEGSLKLRELEGGVMVQDTEWATWGDKDEAKGMFFKNPT